MRLFYSATIFCCYICTCICCLKLHQADCQVGEGFFTSILVGGTQLQCIYYLCRILISRPPRVFRRFKRRSCCYLIFMSEMMVYFSHSTSVFSFYIAIVLTLSIIQMFICCIYAVIVYPIQLRTTEVKAAFIVYESI